MKRFLAFIICVVAAVALGVTVNFPTALDDTTTLFDLHDNAGMVYFAKYHNTLRDAILALEARVGVTGSLVTTSHEYRITQLENGCTDPSVVNVKCAPYGAKGDGTTDDTVAIRSAVASAAGVKPVIFPSGTYIVAPHGSGPMIGLVSGTRLQGLPGATLKLKDSSCTGGIPGRMIANQDTSGTVVPVADIQISGLAFNGNDSNQSACSTSPFQPETIEIQDAARVHIFNCRAFDITARWLTIYRGTEIDVSDNDLFAVGVTQLADPIQLNGPNGCRINHNLLGNTGEGIVLEHATGTSPAAGAAEATNCVIDDNTVKIYGANEYCQANGVPFACCTGWQTGSGAGLCSSQGGTGGSIIVLASYTTVSNNVVVGGNSINIEGGRGFDTHHLTFTGNQSVNGLANGYGLLVITGSHPNADQPLHDVEINGGSVKGAASSCVSLYSAALNAPYNVTIRNLVCDSPTKDGILLEAGGTGGSTTSAASIQRVSLEHVTVRNPCSAGGTCGGLRFHQPGTPGPDFTDIVLEDSEIYGSARYAIWLVGGETRFDVLRNRFSGSTAATFNFASGSVTNYIGNVNTDATLVVAGATGSFSKVIDDNGVPFSYIDPAGAGTGNNSWKNAGNGSKIYCTNCTIANPCAGASTGAQMKMLNGVEVCN